ncbi:MAG: MmgE/PrpD family protein [Variibacter sp.]
MSETKGFIEHLLSLVPQAHSAAVQEAASNLVLDGVAVAALGSCEPGPRILGDMAVATEAAPVATVIGRRARVSGPEAARANGASMHVLDYEPMWNPANHSLSTVLPALFALIEMRARGAAAARPDAPPLSGQSLLAALALGIETQARLRIASGQYEPGHLTFHPPGVVGPLGSAVACGYLLGLDADALVNALGIAASRAGAIQANAGSMTKALHCGQAAASGLESALMASRGFTADADALAPPRGYAAAFFGGSYSTQLLTAPAPTMHVVDPGPATKFYPSQYGTHFVITAALAAREKMPPRATIRSVRIIGPYMPYVDRPNPRTGLAGKFSFQYTAAAALLDGRVGVDSFTDERRFASDMVALLPRFIIDGDPKRSGRWHEMRVDIEVELEDGRKLDGMCDGPPGSWGHRAEPERLVNKARDCLRHVLPAARADGLIATARRVGKLDGDGVLAFIGDLAFDAPTEGHA